MWVGLTPSRPYQGPERNTPTDAEIQNVCHTIAPKITDVETRLDVNSWISNISLQFFVVVPIKCRGSLLE